MKKLLMMLMLICTVNIACWADGDEPETEGDEVELYDDEEIDPIKEGDLGNPLPRMPRLKPYVYINSHTLFVKRVFTPNEIRILKEESEDTVIYNIPVMGSGNDNIILPNSLQGDYLLQLIIGESGYYGYIKL